ncbi:unnamed protein product [Leuciscus chuanchicus]
MKTPVFNMSLKAFIRPTSHLLATCGRRFDLITVAVQTHSMFSELELCCRCAQPWARCTRADLPQIFSQRNGRFHSSAPEGGIKSKDGLPLNQHKASTRSESRLLSDHSTIALN